MTYDYVCNACDHRMEASQRITDAPLITCPECGSDALVRQASGGTAVVLKGGGWARDLYSTPGERE